MVDTGLKPRRFFITPQGGIKKEEEVTIDELRVLAQNILDWLVIPLAKDAILRELGDQEQQRKNC